MYIYICVLYTTMRCMLKFYVFLCTLSEMTNKTCAINQSYVSTNHYDLCPVDSCVNLLSALDSRNGVMSMRTSPHLRALLINNNPCGQQFS